MAQSKIDLFKNLSDTQQIKYLTQYLLVGIDPKTKEEHYISCEYKKGGLVLSLHSSPTIHSYFKTHEQALYIYEIFQSQLIAKGWNITLCTVQFTPSITSSETLLESQE